MSLLHYIDYVEDIYQTLLEAHEKDLLEAVIKELAEITPTPMNTMVEKQTKEDAHAKKKRLESMVNVNVPPTTPGKYLFCIINLSMYCPGWRGGATHGDLTLRNSPRVGIFWEGIGLLMETQGWTI